MLHPVITSSAYCVKGVSVHELHYFFPAYKSCIIYLDQTHKTLTPRTTDPNRTRDNCVFQFTLLLLVFFVRLSSLFHYWDNYSMKQQKHVSTIFLSNGISSTLVIPRKMALKCGLDKPTHVTLEEKLGGILIKKLKL